MILFDIVVYPFNKLYSMYFYPKGHVTESRILLIKKKLYIHFNQSRSLTNKNKIIIKIIQIQFECK